MNKLLLAVPLAALLAGAGFYGFERFERGEIAQQATVACGDDAAPAAGSADLPFDLPLSEGEAVLRTATQGATTVAFASLEGGRDDIVETRDAVLRDLEAVGYRVTGTDQEPGYEAEAQLAGPHTGTLRVKPLCEGLLEVRYKIED